MPFQAIIFDFDGVIVDSEKYWHVEEQAFFHRIMKGWKDEYHHAIVGMRMADTYAYFQKTYGLSIPFNEFTEEYRMIAQRVYDRCAPLDGMPALLAYLNEARIPLAVASSAPAARIDAVLLKFHLRAFFRVIVGAEDIGANEGKPSPAIYLLAAKKMGADPARCIAIEDATNGIRSAKAAGMQCIALRTPYVNQDLSEADDEVTACDQITMERCALLVPNH